MIEGVGDDPDEPVKYEDACKHKTEGWLCWKPIGHDGDHSKNRWVGIRDDERQTRDNDRNSQ